MRLLNEKLPQIPLVAAFETGFHATIEDRLKYYPIPYEWAEKLHIKRWGFHGASHRYISQRTSQLLGRYDLRDHFVPFRWIEQSLCDSQWT